MFFDKASKRLVYIGKAGVLRVYPGYKHHVVARSHAIFKKTVAFPYKPGNSASDNAFPDFFAHGNTEAIPLSVVFNHIKHKVPVGKGFASVINISELKAFF